MQAGAGAPQVALEGINDDLGVGDVVQGRDRAVPDAELLVDDLHDRSQAVGGAGRRRQQPVFAWVKESVVDPVDDVQGSLDRAAHHHTLDPGLAEVGLEGLRGLEAPTALEHQFDPGGRPGHLGGGGAAAEAQALSVDQQFGCAGRLRLTIPASMDGIEAEQVRSGFSGGLVVVDQNDLDAGSSPEGAADQPSDPPEAVDANPHASHPINQSILMHQGFLIG